MNSVKLDLNSNCSSIHNPELERLIEKANHLFNAKGINNRIRLYRRIIKLAKENNAEKEYGIGLSFIAYYYVRRREFNTALDYIKKTLAIAQKLKVYEWLPKLYNWSAYIHKAKGDFSNAIDFYEMEIEINVSTGNEEKSFVAFSVLGNIYEQQNNSTIAQKYYQKAKQLAFKYPTNQDIINNTPSLNTSIIGLLTDTERFEEAKNLCYETLDLLEKYKTIDKAILPYLYGYLSLINYDTGNFSEGMEYVLKAAKGASVNNMPLIFNITRLKAYNYAGLNNKSKAVLYYRKCLKQVEKVEGAYAIKIETLERARDYFKKQGLLADLLQASTLLDIIEAECQTLQAKLKVRVKSLTELDNQMPLLHDNKVIEIPTISKGLVQLTVKSIQCCYTETRANKNILKIITTDKTTELWVRMPLIELFDSICNENFLWLSRNAFVNKSHVEDWEKVAHTGIVKIGTKNFAISRRKRQILFAKTNTITNKSLSK